MNSKTGSVLNLNRSTVATVVAVCFLGMLTSSVVAQRTDGGKRVREDKFRQLEEILPTPNDFRTASGAPARGYWQQRADHVIDVELDDENQRIIGSETITYTNHSPDSLRYLWLQLDPNIFAPDSATPLTSPAPNFDRLSYRGLRRWLALKDFDGGMKLTSVRDGDGKDLPHTIIKTMMRIDLPKPLEPKESTVFSIDWNYQINDSKVIRARTGCEFFEDDGNYIYEMAQWFPRMAAYTDVTGWQHKQFLGSGEFTLEFGNYLVRITVPDDHIVASTGVLQNPEEVLSAEQRVRLAEAGHAKTPVFVVTPDEAVANQDHKPSGKKTWIYKADDVRDFAFASSRKFIWDAQGHEVGGNRVMAMSYYPIEGEPLWSRYSTHAIIHTLNVYSRYTFAYPYPVAISVNGPVGGMEYPMICFNGPRPEDDGTYSKRTKYGLISVVIHEVGHNYFPMIVNSDERQWTWMDEGLNTFLQYLSEQEWEDEYPSRRGEPKNITGYMTSRNQVPIMTNSESLLQFGNNAYAKPATAMNILRETILGRELFDFAFKEYAMRWKFKRPMPADLFRTMEDASAVDLDWFWRGWFYSTDHCDIGIDNLRVFEIDTQDPSTESAIKKEKRAEETVTLSESRDKALAKRVDDFPELKDFYNTYDDLDVTDKDRRTFSKLMEKLDDDEKDLLASTYNFYVVDLVNVGGLVMPVILQVDYEDGTSEEIRIPAEIWRRNSEKISKMILTPKIIKGIVLDPHLETADADLENNFIPRRTMPTRFKLFKNKKRKNPMQKDDKEDEEEDAKEAGDVGSS